MQRFELIIFRQSRVLIGIFITPFVIIGLLLLSKDFENIIMFFLIFALYLLILYYYVVGHLVVYIEDGQLKFYWKRKKIFNYKDIQSVNISEINTIVIDEGKLLKKIKTANRTIRIGTAKVQQKDSYKFICQLWILTTGNSVRQIDSWDEWVDKGYIKIAYRINLFIMIIMICAVLFSFFIGGYKSKHLLFILFLLPQLYFYGQQMKNKIKNKKN